MNKHARKRKHDQRVAHQREQRRKREELLATITAEAKSKKKGKAWIQQQMLVNGYEMVGGRYKRLPMTVTQFIAMKKRHRGEKEAKNV